MSIGERELRARLSSTAALAGPLQFTADGLAARVRRIRRRRGERTAIMAAVGVMAVAAAVAIPLTVGGQSQRVMGGPGRLGPRLTYTVTVNGQTRAAPARGTGAMPLFTITPGERLTMTIEVRVPGPDAITGLWLGITNGGLSGPANMSPILAVRTGAPLRPGAHRFVLHWRVPAIKPGASRELSAQWATSRPEPVDTEGDVAEFAVPLPSSATSPAAVARRLRAMALHAVASCDGAGPAWIRAVRTTFSTAMAVPVVAQGGAVTDNATAEVYLVLMEGDFIFSDGGPVPSGACARAPSGRYFWAVYDAATFVALEPGSLGNRPFPVPLRTLGPVLNLTQRPAG